MNQISKHGLHYGLGCTAGLGHRWRIEGEVLADAPSLPPITAWDLRRASRTFKERTGTGVDKLGPRHYTWLSDELLDVIGRLLMNMEQVGFWPWQVNEAMVHLIPKPTGGRRPIGLVASLPRLWERVRKPLLTHWRRHLHLGFQLDV